MATTHPDNLQTVITRVSGYWSDDDIARLKAAYDYAERAHGDNPPRRTGHPFISHPLAVAEILTEIEADPGTVIAGILHDVVEDTDVTIEEIEERFGESVAAMVNGVTKLTRLSFQTRQERQAGNLRKMFLAMAEDIRVILIKFADRLHNMRTLYALPPDKQEATAQETLQIFAPLAHRLGIWRFKWELEDLAFRYIDPENYYEIAHLLGVGRQEREERIEAVRTAVRGRLEQAGIRATVQGRAKHIYSIAEKMKKQDISFDRIADLAAIRIITDSISDCYAALGLVHDLWIPIQGMFTDYIAKPKANKYQSLHTKVIGPDKQPLEVQIRTWEMHRVAEYGVAAHWRYKEGGDGPSDDQISLLRQVLELETDLKESHEFLELLQLDLFNDQVFVFTPDGDVIDLPAGAGPIDFAYRIHTEVGHQCVGARVNGRQVALNYEFHNGDIAEIITSPSAEPSRDWLEMVKSSRAKSKIRRHLRAKMRAENVASGREALQKALEQHPPKVRRVVDLENLEPLLESFGFREKEDLLASVGYGDIEADTVVRDLIADEMQPGTLAEEVDRVLAETGAAPSRGAAGTPEVMVNGVNGFQCRRSKCCSPLPGDEITGYITRGKGLTIHRGDCKNLRYHADNEPDRVVPLTWSRDDDKAVFQHELEIVAVDRVGLFSHIAAVVAECGINIASANATTTDAGLARLDLRLDIRRRENLDHVLGRLRELIDVISVRHLSLTQ